MFLPVVDLCVDGPFVEPVAVIYPPDAVDWRSSLDGIISDLTNKRLPPSRILFVCPVGRHGALVDGFRKQRARLHERLRATTHVVAAAYNSRGKVTGRNVFNLWHRGSRWTVADDLVVRAAKEYIAKICGNL